MMGFLEALGSAGPYTNNLHLVQTVYHNNTNHSVFIGWHPTNSVKTLKAQN